MTVLEKFRLDGRTAIVTGGNRGIGKGISRGLAQAGANVVIANRNAEQGQAAAAEIANETDQSVISVETDVTDDETVAALAAATIEQFDSIDILVNNAGMTINTPAEEMTLDEWNTVIDVNLSGVFRCTRHIGDYMISQESGSIINISSISAFIANYPQPQVSYNASKAALEGFKNQLAAEWATHGIRVNNINPGYVRTELIDGVLEADPAMAEQWFDQMLLDEMATPDDIAPLAVYLASDAASYVTGTSVIIDGGYTVR